MKVLCYLDPFITADELAISRTSHLTIWLPVFALRRQIKSEHSMIVIVSETELNRNGLKQHLSERKVPFIAVPQKLTDRLLTEFNLSLRDLITETTRIDAFVPKYGEVLRELLGDWIPDIIVGCEQLPRYLQRIFPKAVCIEQPSSGLYKVLKHADTLPYPIGGHDEFKFLLNAALDDMELSEIQRADLERYRKEFIKSYIEPIHFSRRDIDPDRKFRKIFFWPGLLFYGSLVKNVCSYETEDHILRHLLNVLPEDCAIALTRHPIAVRVNAAAVDISPNMSERLIDLTSLSDADGMLSIYTLAACDAMINMQSKFVDVAAVLQKPIFDIDGNRLHSSRLLALDESKMVEWAVSDRGTDVVTLWLKRADNYLHYLLTKKVAAEFFHAGDNAYMYYSMLIKNIREGGAPIDVLPTLSTVDEAIQDIRISLVSDRFDHLLFRQPQNPYEKIRGDILNPAIKVVGFDIFDTALCRYVVDPRDIYELMDADVNTCVRDSQANRLALTKFRSLRSIAEHTINTLVKNIEGDRQITFDEIYEMIRRMSQYDASLIENIKNIEIKTELKYLRPRYSVRALYKLALEYGKRVVFVSDMYLPSSVLGKFLQKNGYTKFEKVYSSADTGIKKANGRLYIKVISDLFIAPREMIFIGDNRISDVEKAREIGISAYHYPSAVSRMMSLPEFRKNFEFYRKNNQFMFHGGMVANKFFDNPFIVYRNSSLLNRSLYVMGYLVSGPAMMSLSLWLAQKMKQNSHDRLLLCARDGYFIQKIYDSINRSLYNGQLAKSSYFYASRMAVESLAGKTPFFLCTLDTSYRACSPELTVRDYFAKRYGVEGFSESVERIFRNAGVALEYSYVEQRHKIFNLILENREEFLNFFVPPNLVAEYFLSQIAGSENPAFFDLGTRGSIPRLLAEATDTSISTYLFMGNDYRVDDSSVESFHQICPSRYDYNRKDVKEEVYEPIFCALHEETTKAYKRGRGGAIEPIIEVAPYTIEARNRSMIQQGMMDFCKDCLSVYGQDIAYISRGKKDLYLRGFDIVSNNNDDAVFLSERISIDNDLINSSGKMRISAPVHRKINDKPYAGNIIINRNEFLLVWVFGSLEKYIRFKGKQPYDYWKKSKNPLYRTFRFFCKKPV